MHARCLWESTGRFRGPKQPYTVNVTQVCVFAGASSLRAAPWGPALYPASPDSRVLPGLGVCLSPHPVCCPAPGSAHPAGRAGQKQFCSWGFVCGWRAARAQMGRAEEGRSASRSSWGGDRISSWEIRSPDRPGRVDQICEEIRNPAKPRRPATPRRCSGGSGQLTGVRPDGMSIVPMPPASAEHCHASAHRGCIPPAIAPCPQRSSRNSPPRRIHAMQNAARVIARRLFPGPPSGRAAVCGREAPRELRRVSVESSRELLKCRHPCEDPDSITAKRSLPPAGAVLRRLHMAKWSLDTLLLPARARRRHAAIVREKELLKTDNR